MVGGGRGGLSSGSRGPDWGVTSAGEGRVTLFGSISGRYTLYGGFDAGCVPDCVPVRVPDCVPDGLRVCDPVSVPF